MKSFINYYIKYPIAGNLLMVFICIGGYFGLMRMKTTFFPETESRIINIQCVLLGASPEEIEEGVVTKIEENLKGISGIEQLKSTSSESSANITIEILKDYDTDVALEDVKNAVNSISSFPAAMEPLRIFKTETVGFAISFSLSGRANLQTLKSKARQVERDLLDIEGISKVNLSGFPDEEIEIAVRENDLLAFQLNFSDIVSAVSGTNLELTGGKIKTKDEELLIRARNRNYYAQELENIVVKSEKGQVIRLSDVADVRDRWEDSPNRSYMNGEPSVVITVQNTLEEDMLAITDEVRKYIDTYNRQSENVKATVVRDSSVVLNQRINLLAENGIIGFMIVTLFLAMFLHWRLALWVALAIPISFFGMFIFSSMIGITINVVSLFGMILVIGILVDDGIVVAESIYQLHESGMERYEAALKGTMRVLPAVFSAIATTVVAFSTFFFLDGRLGEFFQDLAVVVIFSLIFSLVEGALILPAHVAHSKALDPNARPSWITQQFDAIMNFSRDRIYEPILRFSLSNKVFTVVISMAGLILTIGAIQGGIIRTTFFPVIPRDNIQVTLKMPAGTREHLTDEFLQNVEQAAIEVGEEFKHKYFDSELNPIEKIERKIGPTTYEGSLDLTLLDGERRDSISARMISAAIREKTGSIPEAEVYTLGGVSVFGKPISISLLGNNTEDLNAAISEVTKSLSTFPELKDVVANNQEGLEEINIRLNEKGKYLGLDLQTILFQVRQGFFGQEVQRLQRGIDEVRVWVRYSEENRQNIDDLSDMRIKFPDGRQYYLKDIAELSMEKGVKSIFHLDGEREIKVEADIANDRVSVSDVTEELRDDVIPKIMSVYPSVRILFEGQNREQEKTSRSMKQILPIIISLMFFIIALTFRSISQTFIVIGLIPFGLIGVGFGHYLMDNIISLFSGLGVIALIGILVNDALVFVTSYNDHVRSGMNCSDAVYKTGIDRFRPIVLTSMTTIAGLAPLMLEKSFQAQFLIPMAISIAYGLLLITFIILVLLPVLLLISNRIKMYSQWAFTGHKPSEISLESASPSRKAHFLPWVIGGLIIIAISILIVRILYSLSAFFV